jgi:hypothetical protein
MRRTHLGSQDRVVLTRRTSSTVMYGWPEGNGGGGRRPGVVVGSSRCREVIFDGAVLRVWTNLSKRGRSGLSMVARRRWASSGVEQW